MANITLPIDIAGIQAIAQRGVRRAMAFLGVGLKSLSSGPLTSVTLDAEFTVRWFEDPLPQPLAEEIATEYRAWLVGSALKELDQQFSLFLDEVWAVMRLVAYHGQSLPPDFGPDKKFMANTNVADKLKLTEDALGTAGNVSAYFGGYSLARNALTHNSGIVRDRDCNDGGTLVVVWHSPTVTIKGEGFEFKIDQRAPIPKEPMPGEAAVTFAMQERRAAFAVGERILFSALDLSEICFSYENAAESVAKGLQAFLATKGIVPPAGAPTR